MSFRTPHSTVSRKPNHVVGDPTPLPLDSAEFAVNYHKASHWDEMISMNITAETPVIFGQNFTWVDLHNATYLLAHNAQPSNDETWWEDLLAFVEQRKENDERPIKLEHDPAGSFRQLSTTALTKAGFVKGSTSKPFIIKSFSGTADQKSPAAPRLDHSKFEILPTVPGDDLFQKRIDLECTFYPYTEKHIARLGPALTYMTEIGCDKHHVVVERATSKVVSYVTMRYARGVAYLQGAGTATDFRRRGLTRALLHKATEETMARGFPGMATSAWDERAEMTWAALGFTGLGSPHSEWIRI
ncbi:hypothetical protein HDU86_001177 [Geranomyces michiganensis]|nr:hypothetical protein HDU86_001177 [Geranomyces michiganensis]